MKTVIADSMDVAEPSLSQHTRKLLLGVPPQGKLTFFGGAYLPIAYYFKAELGQLQLLLEIVGSKLPTAIGSIVFLLIAFTPQAPFSRRGGISGNILFPGENQRDHHFPARLQVMVESA